MFYTRKHKKGASGAIVGVLFGLILTFGLFFGFLPKATADTCQMGVSPSYPSTNYVDNVHYYKAPDYNTTHNITLTFHVKTTFTLDCNNGWDTVILDTGFGYGGSILSFTGRSGTYYAGNTYSFTVSYTPYSRFGGFSFGGGKMGSTYYNYFGNPPFWTGWLPLEDYPYPVATITYPYNNAEIAGAFNIQGNFTIPSGKSANYLVISFTPVGSNYCLLTNFSQDIHNQTQGTINIPISGIPAGYYNISAVFTGGDFDNYTGATINNVHIVNDIPPALPSGEQTPQTPIFGYVSPDVYYASHSNYTTSTALFDNLANSAGALIQSIGNSLSAFAGKFSLTNAQQTATITANSISTMRSYANNLNSFFGSLPIAQILFLYLLVFVAVILFRLIKNLINLIKP